MSGRSIIRIALFSAANLLFGTYLGVHIFVRRQHPIGYFTFVAEMILIWWLEWRFLKAGSWPWCWPWINRSSTKGGNTDGK